MNLQQLTTFCTVVSEGSMTAAADKLFLTQPAVSQQIRNLEDEVGCELLLRGVRSVKPTLQGQLLFDYAKRILHLTQQAEVALQAMSTELSGEVRIGTLNSLGLYLISPIMGLFLKHNPNLRISLAYQNSEDLLKALKKEELDAVIIPQPMSEKLISDELTFRYLMTDEMWLVGTGRDSTLPSQSNLEQFVQRPVVYYTDRYLGFRKELETKLKKKGLEMKPIFSSDNVGTLKRVIESGLGWGFLPSHSILKQVRTGRMSRVLLDDLKYTTSINMYFHNRSPKQDMFEVLHRAIKRQALGK